MPDTLKGKRIAMFSGGSGTASIAKALVANGADLYLLVNCYDDGKSTGRLRQAIPTMLGPSDVRKNVARFSPYGEALEKRDGDVDWTKLPMIFQQWYDAFRFEMIGFDTSDCPLGNILFAGRFLQTGDFNQTVYEFANVAECKVSIFNVTQGEVLWLKGFTPGCEQSYTEAELSTLGLDIRDIQLTPELPRINFDVNKVLRGVDMIIYGPGTQWSSLLPSYLTMGVSDAIIENRTALKVYIANIRRDKDIPKISLVGLETALVKCMERGARRTLRLTELIEYVLIGRYNEIAPRSGAFDLGFPEHDGEKVVQQLAKVFSSNSGIYSQHNPSN